MLDKVVECERLDKQTQSEFQPQKLRLAISVQKLTA